eukprot:Nk52_evm50s2039 gene=Nk52_evmTU50s2039
MFQNKSNGFPHAAASSASATTSRAALKRKGKSGLINCCCCNVNTSRSSSSGKNRKEKDDLGVKESSIQIFVDDEFQIDSEESRAGPDESVHMTTTTAVKERASTVRRGLLSQQRRISAVGDSNKEEEAVRRSRQRKRNSKQVTIPHSPIVATSKTLRKDNYFNNEVKFIPAARNNSKDSSNQNQQELSPLTKLLQRRLNSVAGRAQR